MTLVKCIFSDTLSVEKSTITWAMLVVNYFHSESASARGCNGDIAHKTKTELDANLRLFYDEAQLKTEKTRVEEHCWNL